MPNDVSLDQEQVQPTTPPTSPTQHVNGVDIFDIATIATEETAEMTVNHPVTGAPTTWVWTVAGPGHPVTVQVDSERAEEAKREETAIRRAQANGRVYKPDARTADEESRITAQRFARRVLAWTPVKFNGADYPHSQENVVKIFRDPKYFSVYRQLLEFITDEKSFMKPSSPTL